MSRRIYSVFPLVLLLAACASNPEAPEPPADNARRAAEINTSLGREYMVRGEYEVALEKLKKAVNSDEGYAPAHTVIAVLYEQIGELDLAGKHYKRAVDIEPRNGDVNNNYGAYLCGEGVRDKAEKYFLRALEDPFYNTPELALTNAGNCCLDEGRFEPAERYFRTALDYETNYQPALIAMARLKYELAEYFVARAFVQRYLSAGQKTVDGLMIGIQIEKQLDDEEMVQEYTNELLRLFPDSSEARTLRRERFLD